MGIVQPWDHRPAIEIDHLRARSGPAAHFAVAAHRGDFSVFDRHRLFNGKFPVDGDDLAVHQNQIGEPLDGERAGEFVFVADAGGEGRCERAENKILLHGNLFSKRCRQ